MERVKKVKDQLQLKSSIFILEFLVEKPHASPEYSFQINKLLHKFIYMQDGRRKTRWTIPWTSTDRWRRSEWPMKKLLNGYSRVEEERSFIGLT
jgi:hypothetical protein